MKLRNALALAAVLAAPLAHAHTGAHSHFDLFAGLSHPLSGADHLLAMLAVGIWGAMLGGAARLALPASFVLAMLLGGVAGHLGMPLLAMALTAGFAVFHGFAHGVEAPADGSFWLYGAGFAVATAALHAAGFTLNQHLTSTARRVLGAGVAATGGLLLSGML